MNKLKMNISERVEINEQGERVIIREIIREVLVPTEVIVPKRYECQRRSAKKYYQEHKEELYQKLKEKLSTNEELRKRRNDATLRYMRKQREEKKKQKMAALQSVEVAKV